MLSKTVLASCLAALWAAAGGTAFAADKDNGKKLYESKCASCHAKDGKGNAAMGKMLKAPAGSLNLIDEESLAKPEDEFVKATEQGVGKMPAYKGKLKPEDISDIAAHVRSLAPAKAEEPKPEAAAASGSDASKDAKYEAPKAADLSEAKKTYAAKCASCHGKDGKGNAGLAKGLKLDPASLDLTAPGTAGKTDAELLEVMKKGAGKMPAYGGKLADEEIDALIRYSRSLAPQKDEGAQKPAESSDLPAR